MIVSKEEGKEIEKSLSESLKNKEEGLPIPPEERTEIRSMTVTPPARALSTHRGLDIEGLQDISAAMLAIPFVKLVQYSSFKTILEDGTDAEAGSFYQTDLQSQQEKLEFVMLRARVTEREFTDEKTGDTRIDKKLLVLAVDAVTEKLFILLVPITSFTSWGRLLSKLKERKIASAWEFVLEATSEPTKNQKGKFFLINFKINGKLEPKEAARMAEIYGEYGAALERQDIPTEENV